MRPPCSAGIVILLTFCSLVTTAQYDHEREHIILTGYPYPTDGSPLHRTLTHFYVAHETRDEPAKDSLYPVVMGMAGARKSAVDSAAYAFGMGYYHAKKLNFNKAQEWYNEAGLFADRHENTLAELAIRVHMSSLSYLMKQVQEAFDGYSEVLAHPSCPPVIRAKMNHNVGVLLMELDSNWAEPDSSLSGPVVARMRKHFNEALAFADSARSDLSKAATSSVYVNLEMQAGNWDRAMELVDTVKAIAKRNDDESRLAFVRIKEAKILDTLGFKEAAFDTVKLAVEHFRSVGNYDQANHASSMLYQLYQKYGMHEEASKIALEMYWDFQSYLDSNIARSTREFRERFDTQQKEHRIEEQALELQAQNRLVIALVLGLLSLALLSLFILQRNKRRAEKERHRLSIAHKQEQVKAVIVAQEKERQRIAKDLHDGIAQQLAGLKLGFQSAIEAGPEADRLLKILDDSTQEVREISHRMMPRTLSRVGLIEAISEMLKNSIGHSSLTYTFEHHGIEGRLPEQVEIVIYRITQELINNVIKHSSAQECSVQLIVMNKTAILIVEDDGRGMEDGTPSSGIGLMNIESRLETLNGNVHFDTSPSGGTLATIRIPLQ